MDCPPNPLWGRLYFVFNPLKRNRWEHRVTSFSDINAFGRSRATSASTAHATYHPCSAREVLYRSRRLSDFVMECCTAFCGLLKILGRINVPWTDRYGAPSCRGHLAVFAPVPPLSGTSRRDTPKEGARQTLFFFLGRIRRFGDIGLAMMAIVTSNPTSPA